MSVLVLLDENVVREIQVHEVKDRQSYEDPPHPLHNDKGGQTGDPEEQVSLVHARRHGERKETHGRAREEQSAASRALRAANARQSRTRMTTVPAATTARPA